MADRCIGYSADLGEWPVCEHSGVETHTPASERMAERERIARELHDTLLQGVRALILTVQSALHRLAPADPARELLHLALRRADDVIEDGVQRILGLRCGPEACRDMPDSLIAAGFELAKSDPAHFSARVTGSVQPLRLAARQEAEGIGREALINAFRHAKARSIQARFTFSDAGFRLRIRDDGRGFNEEALRGGPQGVHWGLTGMHERAQVLGARLSIRSRAAGGTEVDLAIPARVAYAGAGTGAGVGAGVGTAIGVR